MPSKATTFLGAAGLSALLAAGTVVPVCTVRAEPSQAPARSLPASGEELYQTACANCHGANGTGAPHSREAFSPPPPDFTNCNFASREPNADWVAVVQEGGPVRGFSRMMPAFGGVLTVEQSEKIMAHVRSFCPSDAWPRGELNLPRPLFTTKAYPEDEAVWTTTVDAEGRGSVINEIVYEKRLGARSQFEIVVPFGWRELEASATPGDGTDWRSGLGDVAIAFKRVLAHDLESGSIFSVAGEVLLPTGDDEEGFGSGTTVLEPYVAYGRILPRGFFLHAQGGIGVPLDHEKAEDEAFARAALGRTFTSGRFGRAWSPMVEILASRELVSESTTHWDVVPQMQVTLNVRQHVMLNAGARIPLNDSETRDTRYLVYLLWDWFDGGLTEGW
jgi:mono/diheme cytochrome c family protein